jgi:hypothetical protein
MLWEKIMLGQILNRPSPHFISTAQKPDPKRDTADRPLPKSTHESSRAIFERVRERFSA